jgi:hypothetical protein
VRVTLQTTAPPVLVGFRLESSSDWQLLDPDGKRTFEFMAGGPYRIVVACENFLGGTSVYEYARTPADTPAIRFFCEASPFMVTGTTSQPGFVGLGTDLATINEQLSFELLAAEGSFDLVHFVTNAQGQVDRIGLRRDVVVVGDTNLGLVDLAQTSQALVPKPFTVANLAAGESLSATTSS